MPNVPSPPDGSFPMAMGFVDDNQSSTDQYSLNSKILATAILSLIFVTSFVAILYLYVRCVLRRPVARRRRRVTTLQLFRDSVTFPRGEPAPSAGLNATAIAALPTFTYNKGTPTSSSSAECAVCLSTVEQGEMVRLLPNCKHVFHVACIDMWLHCHSTCPVCRATAEPAAAAATATADEVAGEASAPPLPPPHQELCEGCVQEGTGRAKEAGGSSSSSRVSSSFRKMLHRGLSGRRGQGDEMVDIERQ